MATPDTPDFMDTYRKKHASKALLEALGSMFSSSFNRLHEVQKALAEGADPNIKAKTVAHGVGFRPLHLAAKRGAPRAVIDVLLEHGAKIDATIKNKETALHVAAKSGNIQAIDALLDAGAELEALTTSGHTPLATAMLQGSRNMGAVQHIIDRGASLNAIGGDPHPLHAAIKSLDATMVDALLELGLSAATLTDGGHNVFATLAQSRAFEPTMFSDDDDNVLKAEAILKRLIDAGADVHAPTSKGMADNALSCMLGTEQAPLNVVKVLLGTGASPQGIEGTSASHSSSLHRLAARGEHATLQFLIDHGLDVNIPGHNGETLLHVAIQNSVLSKIGNVATTLNVLLKAGADGDAKKDTGETPLYYALMNERTDIGRMATRLLLEHGANPNFVCGPSHLHPLVLAAMPSAQKSPTLRTPPMDGRLILVDTLLTHGANPAATVGEIPLVFNARLPEGARERLEQAMTDLSEISLTALAKGVVRAINDGPSQYMDNRAETMLRQALTWGVSATMMLQGYRSIVNQSPFALSQDTRKLFDGSLVHRLESIILNDTIDQTVHHVAVAKPRARL